MFSKLLLLTLQYAIIHAEAIPGYEEYNFQGNNLPSPEDYPHLYPRLISKPVPYPVGRPIQVYRVPQHYVPDYEITSPKQSFQRVRRPNRLPAKKTPEPEEPSTEAPKIAAHYDYGYSVSDPHTGDSKTQYETRRGDVVKGSYSVVDADGTKRTVDYTADAKHGFNAVVRNEKPETVKEEVKEVKEPVDDLIRQETIYQRPVPYRNSRPQFVPPRRPNFPDELTDEAANQDVIYERPVAPKRPRPYYTAPSGAADEPADDSSQQGLYEKPLYLKKPRPQPVHPRYTIARADQLENVPHQAVAYEKTVNSKKRRPYIPPSQPRFDNVREELEEDSPHQDAVYEKPVKKNRQRFSAPRQTIIRNEYVSIPSNHPRAQPAPILIQPSAAGVQVQHFGSPNYNHRHHEPSVRVLQNQEEPEDADVPEARGQYLESRPPRPDNVELQRVRPGPKKVPVGYEETPVHRFSPVPIGGYRMQAVVAVDPNIQPNHPSPQGPYYVITRFVNAPQQRHN